MSAKKTLVLGASIKEIRYSNKAIKALTAKGIEVLAVGAKRGQIGSVNIETTWPKNALFHTLTLYMGAARQEAYYDQILDSRIKRIIFNPGAENEVLATRAQKEGIETLNACTLVMLATGEY